MNFEINEVNHKAQGNCSQVTENSLQFFSSFLLKDFKKVRKVVFAIAQKTFFFRAIDLIYAKQKDSTRLVS